MLNETFSVVFKHCAGVEPQYIIFTGLCGHGGGHELESLHGAL